jgi:hypothetical protein
MFCTPHSLFGGIDGSVSSFHVLRFRSRFRWYRGRRVQFLCFSFPNPCSAVPRVSGSIFIFCSPVPVFGGTEGAGSSFHILRSRTRFRQYRGRQIQFSYFALPHSFSTVSRAPISVFMFCAFIPMFGVLRVPGPVFIFCAPRSVFGSSFHILHSRFRQYRGRQIQFSYFALPDSISTVSRAPILVLIFCAFRPIFGGTKGASFSFHVLRFRTHVLPRASDSVFMFYAPRPDFDSTDQNYREKNF